MRAMEPIRVGLVGCGNSGLSIHRPRIERLPELFELVAYCDPDAARREKALTHRDARAYAALEEMLHAEPDVELVTIATQPVAEHTALAARALRAGRSVVLEKPIGIDLADVVGLYQVVAETGRTLFAFQNARLHVPMMALRQAVDAGKVGTLRYARVRRPCGGGFEQVLNIGSHLLDQLLFLVGDTVPIEATGHFLAHVDSVQQAGHLYAAVRFADGVLGVVELCQDKRGPGCHDYQVAGTDGAIYFEWADLTADLVRQKMRIVGDDEMWLPDLFEGTDSPVDFYTMLEDRYYRNVHAALREGASPMVSKQDILHQFAIYEAVLRSARSGRTEPVDVPNV